METTLWDWHCFINKVILSTFLKLKLQRKKKITGHPTILMEYCNLSLFFLSSSIHVLCSCSHSVHTVCSLFSLHVVS